MDLSLLQLRKAAKQYRKVMKGRVTERILALIELAKRKGPKEKLIELDYERVAAIFEISTRTLLRWTKAWEKWGARGLIPKGSTGRRPKPISGYTAKKILEYRKKYNWGAEVIQAHLERDEEIKVSQGRINRYLRKKKLLVKTKRKKIKNKHLRTVKVEHPGQHTQNDVKHLPRFLANRKNCYVYNFVDHASKFECKKAYDSYGPSETKDFVDYVLRNVPFSISRWQTDNGIEFTYKYVSLIDKPKTHALDKICKKNGIRHVLIPPGEKELQGLVERNHRMDDEELYHRIRPRDLAEFNRYLEAHWKWKNSKRRRKALDWKTPNEWLSEYREKEKKLGVVRRNQPSEEKKNVPNEGLGLNKGTGQYLEEARAKDGLKNLSDRTELQGPARPQIFQPNVSQINQNGTMPKPKEQEAQNDDENTERQAA